ncbi:MAG: lamin tail domain-containing protein [Gammaproteobacteria bacterium]|nr:lamin tail domain-containing protein [Gammaproteobacteria bacterium]
MRFQRLLSCVKKASLLSLLIAASPASFAQDLVITGVIDGPLTGGIPKAIEVCVLNDVADLSDYGLGSANNGGGTDGEEFTFPAGAASAGTYLYVASEAAGFEDFFGFAPAYTSSAASINGDDAIELFNLGAVIDVFGDINVDGTGEAWEHLDGWAYRNDATGPDGSTFVIANWSFSGINALDGETTNATAATPFPIGSYASCTASEPPEPAADILLSEIVVTPTGGEFIEIYNPTSADVDLSNVYLTDATFAGGGTFYYNIVTGTNAGGGDFSDFHARFPDGATIGAGEFQTIAIAGSDDFAAEYGIDPTYELYEDGGTADAIDDMREALTGSINNQGGLTNGGEVVILYAWDGESDLVQDIDYVVWGDKEEAVDKNGVGIDGPDADGDLSFYPAETTIDLQDVVADGAHAFGESFQRTDFNEGNETQTGGNGVTGDDETSEDLSVTWTQAATTPGDAPPPPPATDWVINEIHADPDGTIDGDANGDGTRNSTEDEFVEILNNSGASADISGWTLSDGFSVRHTFPAGSVVDDGCSIVIFGGGTPDGAFGLSAVQTASTGALGLNNGGDTVTLNNGTADVTSAGYGSDGGDNQSLTRDPDGDGNSAFVKHSVATTSGGTLYSPGTNADGSQFEGCPSAWVINEVHADPDGTIDGDANGDGTRNSSQDEFVEIVNRTGNDVDVSGWTLADGFTVRHTFPAGSVIYDGCSAVVFGGGTPTGAFGNSLVQTATTGSIGMNNGGDTVTLNDGASDLVSVSYGSEGGANQSVTLDPDVTGSLPFVQHSVATDSGGALFSPGTKIDGSQFDGCPVSSTITDIQGAGEFSPLEGQRVIASGVVTAVSTNGFFMQVPDDGDPNTSNGIFVFTGGAPDVAVGDEVEVTGFVDEFFGFTEITGSPVVNVTGVGTVPAPIVFDANVPSPDPDAPSCDIEFECYEGMLVEIPAGVVTASNQSFGTDPLAEVYITAGPNRTFREPGIESPGLPAFPDIPVWDGNPEVFELDPDKLGLPNLYIPGGSTFSAIGVIGFEFGGYEFWPSELTVNEAPLPVATRAKGESEGTVGSFNLFRLFDDIDDAPDGDRDDTVVSADEYALRLAKIGAYIVDVMGSPDILAIQEVESLKVLQDLAATVGTLDTSVSYSAHLVEGNDIGSIDVGFLVRSSVQVTAVTQLGKDEILTFDGSLLHDRPPLLLEATMNDLFPISVMVLHMRSLGGIEGERTQQKRYEQAISVASKVQDIQTANPDVNLVVIGDFNAFEFTDGYVDLSGVLKGDFDPNQSVVCSTVACEDVVSPNLTDEVLNIDPAERYSFIFRGNAQVLDHAMTSQALAPLVAGLEFGRGNADAAVILVEDDGLTADLASRSSDHDGLVLYIFRDEDRDGVGDDVDVCPATVLPERGGSHGLGVNRFADINGDGIFETKPPKGEGPKRSYDIFDTAGCSCEQIVEEAGLGNGHIRFGCSIGVMDTWVDLVSQ